LKASREKQDFTYMGKEIWISHQKPGEAMNTCSDSFSGIDKKKKN
jgi:hypothetical protein